MREIMMVYAKKTDGAKIEVREASIMWSYKDADGEFGCFQANELITHLNNFF